MHQLTPTIYIGDYADACNIKLLQQKRITQVLSVINHPMPARVRKSYADNNIVHHAFLIDDNPVQDLNAYFEPCYNIMNSTHITLVHCHMGKSRSAAIVLYYMMRFLKINLDAAMLYVKRRRPIVQPNSGFMRQLREAEKKIEYAAV